MLADNYIYAGKFSEAIKIYNQLEKDKGLDKQIIIQKQKLYLENNDLNGAITEIKKLIEVDKTDLQAYEILSELYLLNNEKEIIVNRVNIGVPQGIFDEKYYFLSDDNKTITIGWNNDGQGYDFNTNDGDIYWTITKTNQNERACTSGATLLFKLFIIPITLIRLLQ